MLCTKERQALLMASFVSNPDTTVEALVRSIYHRIQNVYLKVNCHYTDVHNGQDKSSVYTSALSRTQHEISS